jgi:hypothetical protein
MLHYEMMLMLEKKRKERFIGDKIYADSKETFKHLDLKTGVTS